ncbi:hypothetical protein HU200_001021 [Digitaria exilis]|uniref:F-box domain-containing protein n=1 Tax=Digitaria exilis TaxID=1010633 RepID=A0A835G290_9POAL|nr:hypothetical protein HU200_001021 [Digitaria exilis]
MDSEETKTKKKQKEQCIINCIPRDLIEQIFFRLPVSSLLKCIGVCKQWRKVIRDPEFIAGHLERAPCCALIFFPQESVQGKAYPSDAVIFDEAWSQSTLAVPTSTIKIANLATGESLHLDKPIKNLKGDHFSFYRFAFHQITKEYKVTHFVDEHKNYSQGTFNIVQVYTLGSDKWKDVKSSEALSLSCVKNSGVVSVDDNGANSKLAVMCFDLSKENFTLIQVPEVVIGDSYHRCHWITEIDGKACIASAEVYRHVPRMLSGEMQIWTLDNNNIEKRWSHKYSIQHAPNFLPGPHFVHRDRIIMHSRQCNLYAYELLGKNVEITKKLSNRVELLDFSPYKPQNMQSFVCVKSLVRLDAYKKAGIIHGPKRQNGWELKKWEVWERELSHTMDLCGTIHQKELKISVCDLNYHSP